MSEERQICQAMTRAGTRCRRPARPGSHLCWQHGGGEEASATGLFAALFTAEEMQALAEMGDAPSVDDVMPVLLVAIRRALESGAPANVVVRACEAYVRALRERRQAGANMPAGDLEHAVSQALDALGKELDIEL